MAERMSDRRLEAVLVSIGAYLSVDEPPTPTVGHHELPTPPVGEGVGRRRSHRLLAAAAIVAILAATPLVVAPARRAVADWLGIGSTRIEMVSEPPTSIDSLPTIVDDADLVPIQQAEAALGRPLPDTSETVLGPPDGVISVPEGGGLMVWRDTDTTLWIRTADAADSINTKTLGPEAEFRFVADLGDDAMLITGDHVLQTPQRRISADNVLLWIDHGIEYRLESALAGEELIEIARAIQ